MRKTLKSIQAKYGIVSEQRQTPDAANQYFRVFKKNGVRLGFSKPDANGVQKYKGYTKEQFLASPAYAAAIEISQRSNLKDHGDAYGNRMGKASPNGKDVIRVK